ncbi:MAG: RNA-splicing ligase RtcB [Phycisphaerae bacterium]|nr:MAG: RNA-splicing ligase RtcB [Phycisphaerae bacterium]
MSDPIKPNIWLTNQPESAVKQTIDRLCRAPDVVHVAVMPDVHLAAGVSNGVAVATERLIFPAAVGGDIGCGYSAVAFAGDAGQLQRRQAAEYVLESLPQAVPIIRHSRRNGLPELEGELNAECLSQPELVAKALSVGREELGTLGRGNHFLEFQQDDEGRMWVMVHSGSRAMGQYITAAHLKCAEKVGGGLSWLDANTDEGQAYLRDVKWARAYAAESRRRMLKQADELIAETLGVETDPNTWINTDHNHVQCEEHGGRKLWVHRKGVNQANEGAPNIIPGSMATATYHVQGRGNPESLNSSSHGAGRKLSRSAARAKIKRKDLNRQLKDVWIDPNTAAKLTDESPAAYKDIESVMRAQKDLVRIVRKMRPVLCYKGI